MSSPEHALGERVENRDEIEEGIEKKEASKS